MGAVQTFLYPIVAEDQENLAQVMKVGKDVSSHSALRTEEHKRMGRRTSLDMVRRDKAAEKSRHHQLFL